MRLSGLGIALLCGLFTTNCFSATSGLDESFGTAGVVTLGPSPTSNLSVTLTSINALFYQADGSIVVAGRTPDPGNTAIQVPVIGQLNSNGSWDTAFGDYGLFVLPSTSPIIPWR